MPDHVSGGSPGLLYGRPEARGSLFVSAPWGAVIDHEPEPTSSTTMHAHSYATPERTQAPAQMLRGVAGACAPLAGGVGRSRELPGFSGRVWGSIDFVGGTTAPRKWSGGLDRDFGSSVGGGPV